MKNRFFKNLFGEFEGFGIIVVLIVIAIIGLAGGGYVVYRKSISKSSPKACTQEAKICPDGSTVGRTGPNCEFAACSSPTTQTTKKKYFTKEECEKQTGKSCVFETCDLNCPSGFTKGWVSVSPPDTIDISTWKTYRNEKYGFEVKYPPAWVINDQSYTNQNIKNSSLEIESPARHDIRGYESAGAKFFLEINFNNGKITVDSSRFIKIKEPRDQAVIIIPMSTMDLMKTQEYKIAQQIIQTAKILNSIDTSTWKTYRNEKYGFEFKYPNDLTAADPKYLYPAPGKSGPYYRFPKSYFTGSSLFDDGTGILFDISENTKECLNALSKELRKAPVKITINDLDFTKIDAGDCGAGTCVGISSYSIIKNGVCYQAYFTDDVTNPGGYRDATPEKIQTMTAANIQLENKLDLIFQQILSTFKFTK